MPSSSITLVNADIILSDLDELGVCSCMYSDPPWGLGNLRYWRTMNGQPEYVSDWDLFLSRLREVYARHVVFNGPALIEMGVRFTDDVRRYFGRPEQEFRCLYNRGKNENRLLVFNGRIADVSGMTGVRLVETALATLDPKPSSVFEPCAGKGTTLKVCKKLGLDCYANELNPARYAIAKRYATI